MRPDPGTTIPCRSASASLPTATRNPSLSRISPAMAYGEEQSVRILPSQSRGMNEKAPSTRGHDVLTAYVDDLPSVVDLEAARAAGVPVGAGPVSGARGAGWARIPERRGL